MLCIPFVHRSGASNSNKDSIPKLVGHGISSAQTKRKEKGRPTPKGKRRLSNDCFRTYTIMTKEIEDELQTVRLANSRFKKATGPQSDMNPATKSIRSPKTTTKKERRLTLNETRHLNEELFRTYTIATEDIKEALHITGSKKSPLKKATGPQSDKKTRKVRI